MLTPKGVVKLCDFGFAKKIVDRSYTLCGTPEYLAPELISMNGHSTGVDWWALGVFMYELLFGYTPFTSGGNETDSMRIYTNISRIDMKIDYEYGAHRGEGRPCDEACSLMRGLMTQNQLRRLGCRQGGALDVREHEWFNGFDFDALLRCEIVPPYTPDVESDTDLRNFDIFEDADDLFEGAPYDETANDWDIDF